MAESTQLVKPSGPMVRKGRSKQDYGTPWEFIHAVEKRFGKLTIDLAASAANAKAPTFYTEADDSLSKPWGELTGLGWLNPPFADIEPWAARCADLASPQFRILLLTPASVGSEWFARHVHKEAIVLGLRPRITFEGTKDPYPKDLMLSVFGTGAHGFDTWRWR